MASPFVYDHYKSLLQNTVGGAYPILDWDQIEPTMEQGTNPFIVLYEIFSDVENVSVGHRCMEESGEFEVLCFVPSAESSDQARRMAEGLRQPVSVGADGGLRTYAADPPYLARENDGLWTVAAITSAYTYEYYL